MLVEAGVLGELESCIVVDLERDLAWVDWPAVEGVAGHVSSGIRAILLVASIVAHEGAYLGSVDQRAIRLAVEHLGSWVPAASADSGSNCGQA